MTTTVPAAKFDLDLVQGKTTQAMTEAGAEKDQMWMVPVHNFAIVEGFNVRVTGTPRSEEAHLELVNSMVQNGFYGDKPLAGFVRQDGEHSVIVITDGHRRYRAINAANEILGEGMQIEKVPVIVKPQGTTLEDLTIAMAQANSGEPLTMFEQAILVKRLVGYNMDKAVIAEKLSKTPRHIDNLLVLAGVPAKVRQLIVDDEITATQALQEMRKNPAKAATVLTERVSAAKAKGKTKAAPKDSGPKLKAHKIELAYAAGASMGETLKTLAGEIRELVAFDGDDIITSGDGKIAVIVYVPAPVKAEKKKAAAQKKAAAPKKAAAAAAPKKAKPAAKAEGEKVAAEKPDVAPPVGEDASQDLSGL
jgi:ParB family transcriptional regulator, chromosome partitioning protein